MFKTIFGLIVLAGLLDAQAIRGNGGFNTNKMKNGDDNYEPSPIGFNVNFFGQLQQTAYISNNGNLTFGGPFLASDGTAAWVPLPLRQLFGVAMIAPFFADVDTTLSAPVTYGRDTVNGRPAFGVNYIGVGYYKAKTDKLNSFQLVLIERGDTGAGNFDIEFNYGSIQWDIGENTRIGRAYASVGYTNGLANTANSAFELPGSLGGGAFLDSGGFALIRQSRNSGGVAGRLVFEVRNGNINNTTLIIQPDKTILNCPDITIVARGSGYTTSSQFITPQFQYALKENGQTRQITEAFATRVSDAPAGTYDFTIKYRGAVPITATGAQTTSDVSLTVTLPAPNGDGATYTATDSKTLRNCGLAADCGTLPKDGRVGFTLRGQASASGGVPPYVFSAPNGASPGLSLGKDGVLTGAPTTAGNFSYTVKVDDQSVSPVQFAVTTCAINVLGTNTPLTGACATPAGTAGSAYQGAITASGGAGQYTFSLSSGSFPPGLAINATGVISGTIAATAAGAYPFTVTVRDAAGITVPVNCSIQVTPLVIPVPTITALAPAYAVVGSPAFQLNVTGTNFTRSSVFVWNGFLLSTSFTSATALVVTIPANLLGAAGSATVFVRNSPTVQSVDFGFEVFPRLSYISTAPASLVANSTATAITIDGDGFLPGITIAINGTSAPVTRVSTQQLRAQIPANLLMQVGTLTVRLINPNGVNLDIPLTVGSGITVTPTFSVDKPAVITDQSTATVRLAQAVNQALTGALDITFVPAADNSPNNGATDFPRFTSVGTRRIPFTIAANATSFSAPIDQGSVAGTATITLSSLTANGGDVLAGARPTQTLTIDSTVPLILPGSVGMVRTATGFNVEVTAISTLRSLTAGSLTFTLASGVTNGGSTTFPIDNLPTLGTSWFQSASGKTEGGAFKLTIPFTFEGDFNNLSTVQVTLSNSRGAGAPVTGPRR